jgi:G3E family GTPase
VRGARIPVTVVTGFLGAGKTTLIRTFLAAPEGQGSAVVVNEFGEVGIDDVLMRASTDEVVLLENGCLCCNTRNDLQLVLRRLVADRERCLIPAFSRVVIETSGLADPSPILQTFSTDRALGGEFFVVAIVAVIDAATGVETLAWSSEARRQAILADRLVVSKADLAGSAAVERLLPELRWLNARATVTLSHNGILDPACFTSDPAEARDPTGFVAEAAHHSDGICSFVLREEQPLHWPAFTATMEMLMALRGPDLLRIKGMLNVEGCRGPVVVQFVQHLAHPPVELAAWPSAERHTRLVFITRGVAERQVRDLFRAVNAISR